MWWSVIMSLLFLSGTMSLSLEEEQKKRNELLFGPRPTQTSDDLNRTSELLEACVTAACRSGVCTMHYLCNAVTTSTDNQDNSSRPCPRYLQVCCHPEDVRLISLPRVPHEDTNLYAGFGEFPWMVALLKRSEATAWSQEDYLSGGSIIHPSVVMTAAHKVNGRQTTEVKCRAGEWDTQTEGELYPHQDRNVKKIVQQEYSDRLSVNNSIALLILETPFDLDHAPHIGVACVMPQLPPEGTLCYSMGWGQNPADEKKYPVILKKIEQPIISREKCQKALRQTRLGEHFTLHPSMLCAGGQVGKDACVGDGGAPLVCPIGNVTPGKKPSRLAIAGVMAWGLGCGTATPAVYVNVPHLHGWLAQRMREEGFGPDSYTYSP